MVSPNGRQIVYSAGSAERAGVWRMGIDGTEATRLVSGRASLPEISPDGRYVAYLESPLTRGSVVRVVSLPDGAPVPFEIRISRPKDTVVTLGRLRWMPDGRAIAFIGQDENGVTGVFVQDFVPGKDTSATLRKLGGFDPEAPTESFAISPDGSRMVVTRWEQLFGIMMAEGLPEIVPSRPRGR